MAKGTGKTTDSKVPNGDNWCRRNIALIIIVGVFVLIAGFGIVALLRTDDYASVKDILTLLLPVLGTWVGTVLAFYFSKENFESAARSTAALVNQLTPDEKLRSTLMKDAMIPMDKAVGLRLGKPEKDIRLKPDVIDAILGKEKRERLPILDTEGRIKYIAHRSLIDRFLVQAVVDKKVLEDVTLADLLTNAECKKTMTAFRTLLPTSTLAEAKHYLDTIPDCSDVFATEDGTADAKAVGWVTNVIVTEQARV